MSAKNKVVLDKVYDKNGNEIPPDYYPESFTELEQFLTTFMCRLKYKVAEQENINKCA